MAARALLAMTCSLIAFATAPGTAAADLAVPDAIYDLPLDGTTDEVAGNVVPLDPIAAASATVMAVNRAREAHGLQRLRRSRSLGRSARRYAVWMLHAGYFGHQPRIRASRGFRRLGETLAIRFRGTAVPSDAGNAARRDQAAHTVRDWLESPSHRPLLLSRRFTMLGAGCATGLFRDRDATTWVLHFGARR
jgi:uncharacterized protein YkwD